MFNSYELVYGEPNVEEVRDELFDISCEVISAFDYNNSSNIESNTKAFLEAFTEYGISTLTRNEKACLLDGAFHHANENFYELEDEDPDIDVECLQEDFLEAFRGALAALGGGTTI